MVPQPSSPTHPIVADEAAYGNMGMATTTVSGLDDGQVRGNITKTFPTTTPNVYDPIGFDAGGGIPSHMEHMGGSRVIPSPTRDETEFMPP